MSQRRSRAVLYRKDGAAWQPLVDFTSVQIAQLLSICDDPQFIEQINEVARHYAHLLKLHGELVGKADTKRILEDFKDSLNALAFKCQNLPMHVESHLAMPSQKLWGRIEDFNAVATHLQQIQCSATIALQGFPAVKTREKMTAPADEAAAALCRVFKQFQLPFSASDGRKGSAAVKCLRIVFKACGRESVAVETAAGYVQRATKKADGIAPKKRRINT